MANNDPITKPLLFFTILHKTRRELTKNRTTRIFLLKEKPLQLITLNPIILANVTFNNDINLIVTTQVLALLLKFSHMRGII